MERQLCLLLDPGNNWAVLDNPVQAGWQKLSRDCVAQERRGYVVRMRQPQSEAEKVGHEDWVVRKRKRKGRTKGPMQGMDGFMTSVDAQRQEACARIIPQDSSDDAPCAVRIISVRAVTQAAGVRWHPCCEACDRLGLQGYRCMGMGLARILLHRGAAVGKLGVSASYQGHIRSSWPR